MKSCFACGRPPQDVCAPCLSGNPPPEKLAADRLERETAAADERERVHAQRVRKTQQALTEIPELDALVDLFEIPGTGLSSDADEGSRGGLPDSKPPVDLDVVDLRDRRTKADSDPTRDDAALDAMPHTWRDGQGRMVTTPGARREGALPVLASWTRLVSGELLDADVLHVPAPEDPTVIGDCTFLLQNHSWIAQQPWFDEFADDIVKLHRDLARTCRVPVRASQYTCTKCGWDVQSRDNGTWFECTGCKRAWTEIELHRMAERRRPKPLAECANLTDVSLRSLRTAVSERRLRPVARDGNTDLFDLDDVLPIAAQVKLNRTRPTAATRG